MDKYFDKGYLDFMDDDSDIVIKMDAPIFASYNDINELICILQKGIKEIEESKNIRHIVIETWLIIDYFVRQTLANVLDIDKYNCDNFDIRYELLPSSFIRCLESLKKLLDTQRKLDDDPKKNELKFNISFIYYLLKYHKEFHNQLMDIVQLFYNKYYPELAEMVDDDKVKLASTVVTAKKITNNKASYCVK